MAVMNGSKRWLLSLLVALISGCLTITASAQGTSSGTIALGQPVPNQIEAGGSLNYDYTLAQPSEVAFQALSDTAQPTITILRDGTVVASQPNADGALTVTLNALLDPGAYVVRVSTANNTAGLTILVLQSEAPVTTLPLSLATPMIGAVNPQSPLALYRFSALNEPAFLYVDSSSPASGVSVRLVNASTGHVSAQVETDLLGARFRIPAGSAVYQVEVRSSAATSEAFTVCLAAVSSGGCETGSAPSPAQPTTAPQPALQPTVEQAACVVMAAASGGVNIRQSASTSSIILGRLPEGASVNATGISPGGQFFAINYNGIDGWVALSVVSNSGACASVPVVNPPPIIAPPTAIPAPTQPAPPTQTGPCLITIQTPTYIYVTTDAIQDNLFDQVAAGTQLTPIGRLADNSWWKTNDYGAWIQTSLFGHGVQVSGDCSALPVASP